MPTSGPLYLCLSHIVGSDVDHSCFPSHHLQTPFTTQGTPQASSDADLCVCHVHQKCLWGRQTEVLYHMMSGKQTIRYSWGRETEVLYHMFILQMHLCTCGALTNDSFLVCFLKFVCSMQHLMWSDLSLHSYTRIQGSLFPGDIKMRIGICLGDVTFTCKQYITNIA